MKYNTFFIVVIILCFSLTNYMLTIEKASASTLSSLQKVYVNKIHVKDNIIIPQKEFSQMTAPYEDREVTIRELEDLRLELSKYYVEQGYINSGVLISEQNVSDGNIEFLVIAGKITETAISGNTWLTSEYIASRLELATREEGSVADIIILISSSLRVIGL
jgi:hemolysin activation/secretion protein